MADFEIEDDDDYNFSSGWDSKKKSSGLFGGGGDDDNTYNFEYSDKPKSNKKGATFSLESSDDSSPIRKPSTSINKQEKTAPNRSNVVSASDDALTRANNMLAKYSNKPLAASTTSLAPKKKISMDFNEDDISVSDEDESQDQSDNFDMSESHSPIKKGITTISQPGRTKFSIFA
jgi:hypothetical protein